MRKYIVFVPILALAALAGAMTLRSEIQDWSSKVNKAMIKKDFKTINALMKKTTTSDFVYTNAEGSMTLDQMLAAMKGGLAGLGEISSATTTLVKLTESKTAATAICLNSLKATITGKDKKAHKMSYSSKFTETLVMVGKDWKISKMISADEKTMLDGKLVDMSKMGTKPAGKSGS